MTEIINNKDCYIFDMDGTLINLEELNHNSYSNTINEFFKKEISNEEYQRYFSGTKTAKAFEDYIPSKAIKDFKTEELIKHFRKQKEFNLKYNFDNSVSLIPGAREYLVHLKSKNKTIILATSTIKEFVDIIVEKLEISEFFDYIVTAEDVKKGKPNPEIFLYSLKKADVAQSRAVIFEDSKNGIAAAKESGILCVGIHSKGLNDSAVVNADIVIEDFNQLLEVYE